MPVNTTDVGVSAATVPTKTKDAGVSVTVTRFDPGRNGVSVTATGSGPKQIGFLASGASFRCVQPEANASRTRPDSGQFAKM